MTLLDEPSPWERACREGWEGVIAKRRDSPYESRPRTDAEHAVIRDNVAPYLR